MNPLRIRSLRGYGPGIACHHARAWVPGHPPEKPCQGEATTTTATPARATLGRIRRGTMRVPTRSSLAKDIRKSVGQEAGRTYP